MKILFDVNVPRRLRRLLPGHEIITAQDQGWELLENGDFLQAAEAAGFDVMVTGDKNIAYQQNLSMRTISLVVLSTIDWRVVQHAALAIAAAVEAARPQSYHAVDLSAAAPRRARTRRREP